MAWKPSAVALVLVCVMASRVFAQEQAGSATADNQNQMIYMGIIGVLATLATLATNVFALWKRGRERKWDAEDREEARLRMQRTAEMQLEETAQVAVALAKQTEAKHAQLTKELSKNTEITKQVREKADAAYTAANNFAARMEALRSELKSRADQGDRIEDQGGRIEGVSVDTNVKVTEIKEGK